MKRVRHFFIAMTAIACILNLGCQQPVVTQTTAPVDEEQYQAMDKKEWVSGTLKVEGRMESTPAGPMIAIAVDKGSAITDVHLRFADLDGTEGEWMRLEGSPDEKQLVYSMPYQQPAGTAVDVKITTGGSDSELDRWRPKLAE